MDDKELETFKNSPAVKVLESLGRLLSLAEPYMKNGVHEDWQEFIATVQQIPAEFDRRVDEKVHSHMQTAFDDKYAIGETVFNNSGWGVGSSGTPLRIKSILLEVDWEGSKSSRYLKSSDVSHKWLGGDK